MNFAGEGGGGSDPPSPLDPHMKHMLERFCLFRISRWLSTREVAGRKAIECSSPLQLSHTVISDRQFMTSIRSQLPMTEAEVPHTASPIGLVSSSTYKIIPAIVSLVLL